MSELPATDFNLQHIQEQIARSRDKSERKHLRELIAYMNKLRAENENLRSALKVIRTWASVDSQDHEERAGHLGLLVPESVMNLCDRTLGENKCES